MSQKRWVLPLLQSCVMRMVRLTIRKKWCWKVFRKHSMYPVSYTHLDVYKRQDDDMLSLIPAFDGKYPEKASEFAVTDAFFASENKSPEINAIVQLNLDGTLTNYTIVGI